ncbi:MAG TPA: O-antigen ligase family protein [Candidatus Dormibacteraeota bacterium]
MAPDLKMGMRRWLIVALAAGLPIPYAVRLLGSRSGAYAVDLPIWAVVVVILVLTGSKEWKGLRHDRVAWLLFAYAIISALSLPIGIIAYHNLEGVRSFAYQLVLISNFAVGYLILRDIDDIELLIRGFVASVGAISTALAVYLLQAGILGSVHEFHNSEVIRSAIYGWPNYFSVLVAVAFVMCLYVITTSTGLWRRVYIGLGIGMAACEALTFSKTGWAVLALALWLLWVRFWRVRRQLMVALGLILAALVLLITTNDSFKRQIFTLGTLDERLRFMAVVFQKVNPLMLLAGSGSQSVDTLLAPYAQLPLIPGVNVGDLTSHDEFLNVLVKSGLIGLLLLVIALITVIVRSHRLSKHADSHTATLFRYWFAAGLAIIASLFASDELHYWLVGALFWMMAGAAVHMVRRTTAQPVPGRGPALTADREAQQQLPASP